MEEIRWENPTTIKRTKTKGRKWAKVRSALINHPMEWALIKESPRPTTAPTDFSGPQWERNYRNDNGVWKVYVRYVGIKVDAQ